MKSQPRDSDRIGGIFELLKIHLTQDHERRAEERREQAGYQRRLDDGERNRHAREERRFEERISEERTCKQRDELHHEQLMLMVMLALGWETE